jgi:hypothetical protein
VSFNRDTTGQPFKDRAKVSSLAAQQLAYRDAMEDAITGMPGTTWHDSGFDLTTGVAELRFSDVHGMWEVTIRPVQE